MDSKYKYNILAIDDEIFNVEAIERTFRKEFQVFTSTTPAEALKIFKEENIHLVIADQRMPEMTGVELLAKMKDISDLPIRIVLSAYTDVEYLIDAINRGEVYRYITKPWAPSDLKITVKKALEHYQAMVDRRELVEILLKKNLELNSKNETLQKTLRDLESAQQKILQMERLSIIGRMGGMIIHDLKQPLDIIRSAAETMNSYELKDQERSEITQMIKYEVDRFFDMIHELLDYTKGKISWDLEHIKLSDFWSVTESRIRNYVRSYDVGLRFYPVDEDALLFVDRHRLQRAFINLVKNAVDAFRNNPEIEAPEIAFRVGVSRDKVIFEVADNGPGVNSEIKGEIFSPFVSGNKEFGVGLGLTIVQYIIRELGGEIKYRENSPQGSIFTITLLKSEAPVEGEA